MAIGRDALGQEVGVGPHEIALEAEQFSCYPGRRCGQDRCEQDRQQLESVQSA
ncbi:hypothetical protein D3C83_330580 [compost metagenome]